MKFTQVTWYSKLLALMLFVALPFIGFYAGVWYQKAVSPPKSVIKIQESSKDDDSSSSASLKKVNLKTSYKNGVLTYSGFVQLPSPCHKLKEETLVIESFPEQVQVRLTIQDPDPTMMCAQVVTEKEFSGEVKVSEKATISVFINGKKVE
ncbi:MAG: hypothetical protein Q8O75_02080 [bacterium]|nr:hypothetical protein [bacterium]